MKKADKIVAIAALSLLVLAIGPLLVAFGSGAVGPPEFVTVEEWEAVYGDHKVEGGTNLYKQKLVLRTYIQEVVLRTNRTLWRTTQLETNVFRWTLDAPPHPLPMMPMKE